MLSGFLKTNKLYLKTKLKKPKNPIILEILDYKDIKVFLPIAHNVSKNLVLCSKHRTGYYIEIEFRYTHKLSFVSYIVEPLVMSITTDGRSEGRYKNSGKGLSVGNFKLLNKDSLKSLENASEEIKEIFGYYTSKLLKYYSRASINTYGSEDGEESKLIYKHKKILFIQDRHDISYYFSGGGKRKEGSVLISEKDFIESKYLGKRAEDILREEDSKAVLYYPIETYFSMYDRESIGYIKLNFLEEDIVLEEVVSKLYVLSHDFVDALKEKVQEKHEVEEEVLDVSKGGIQLHIKDDVLNKYFNENEEIGFDIVFSADKVRRYWFRGNVVYRQSIDEYSSHVGLIFTGGDEEGFDMIKGYIERLKRDK